MELRSIKQKAYYVYILSNMYGVLYIGMTNNIKRRMEEHASGQGSRFTRRYRVQRLLYWEEFLEIEEARRREMQIKSWRRSKKLALIRKVNPKFKDLAEEDFSEES